MIKLKRILIENFRSIKFVELKLKEGIPVVLFGPNNAGKSNILHAIDFFLGEKYPSKIEIQESDIFNRTKENSIKIKAEFSEDISEKCPKCFGLNLNYGDKDNIFVKYSKNEDGNFEEVQLYLKDDDRKKCRSYYINAQRDINTTFSYSSKYSLLSKFTKSLHNSLSDENKENLSKAFEIIQNTFQTNDTYKDFFNNFKSNFSESIKGFVHSLDVDFSAYDPNNYAKLLRIIAKDGTNERTFEEFGTGEQQILFMAFVQAYMTTFNGENIVLIIEEPEAHLHPLAQKWFKEYVKNLCKDGVQVILSTHSPDLVDIEWLDGLVRVYKEEGQTKIIQLTKEQLVNYCNEFMENNLSTIDNIIPFYSTRLTNEQLRGLFAENILLVEGSTEALCLPIYLKKIGFNLIINGIDIINCGGKTQIPYLYRIYTALGYKVFAIFDGDSTKNQRDQHNDELFKLYDINIFETDSSKYVIADNYAYFGDTIEPYFEKNVSNYKEDGIDLKIKEKLNGKPTIAKVLAERMSNESIPKFIYDLKDKLENLCKK